MSALILIKDANAAHIVTDGAGCIGGRLMTLESKQWIVAHLGTAVGFRGHLGFARRLRHLTSNCETHDDLKQIGAKLRRYRRWARWLPRVFEFDLAIAGHDGQRPIAWLVSSVDRPGAPAFEAREVKTMWAAPVIDDMRGHAGAVTADFDKGVVALLDEQRRSGDVLVGGYIQATTVDADGINTRCLKRYRDRLLKSVDRQDVRAAQAARQAVLAKGGGWR